MVRSSIRRLPRAGRQKQKCLVVSRGRTRASAPVRAHSKWAGDELGLTFRFSILGPSMYLNIPFILNRSLWSDGSRSVHSMRPVLVQPGPITHVFIVSSCSGVRVRVPFLVLKSNSVPLPVNRVRMRENRRRWRRSGTVGAARQTNGGGGDGARCG
jgi:hypothetical protein